MTEKDLFQILLYSWFALSVVVFLMLLFISAPYGRHGRTGWGPRVPGRLGWIIMELPAVLVIAACYVMAPRPPGVVAWVFLAMWQIHYLYRALIYPFRLRTGSQRSMPLMVALMGVFFNGGNGYLNGRFLTALSPGHELSWLADPRFLAGVALFVVGLAINHHSDHVLLNLRKPGETGYKIPTGGAYRWVSCPNYLGEMLEWSGWALATWTLPGLAFAVWTAANLVPRALTHHRWYKSKFPDYPRGRRAVIPFIF